MPIQRDPTIPIKFGVYLYRTMLTKYPKNTVENPTIVTFPDFSVTNKLAIYKPDENPINRPTSKNKYISSSNPMVSGFGRIKIAIAFTKVSVNPWWTLTYKVVVFLSFLVITIP